jgi:uncharacterized membrane protein YgcG
MAKTLPEPGGRINDFAAILDDATEKEQVIRNDFTPPFRDGDYRLGILAGTRRIAEIVRRNETLTAQQIQALVISFLIGGARLVGAASFASYLMGNAVALVLVRVAALMLWWGLRRTRDPSYVGTRRGPGTKKDGRKVEPSAGRVEGRPALVWTACPVVATVVDPTR